MLSFEIGNEKPVPLIIPIQNSHLKQQGRQSFGVYPANALIKTQDKTLHEAFDKPST